MDIGFLTFRGAKPGETLAQGYARDLDKIVAADEMGWDGIPYGPAVRRWEVPIRC